MNIGQIIATFLAAVGVGAGAYIAARIVQAWLP